MSPLFVTNLLFFHFLPSTKIFPYCFYFLFYLTFFKRWWQKIKLVINLHLIFSQFFYTPTHPSFTPFTGGTQVPPYPPPSHHSFYIFFLLILFPFLLTSFSISFLISFLFPFLLTSFSISFLILLPVILILIVLYLTILLQILHMRVIQYNSVCMVNHLPPEVSPYGLVLKLPTPLVQ